MKKVLIICTGNSCRSIMAEGLITHFLGDEWEAYSAGTHPSYVHPYSIKALQELGIDTRNLRSKSISEFWDRDDLDLLITVCDHAEENCPSFYKDIPRLHIPLADPVRYGAWDEESAMPYFRELRSSIVSSLFPILKEK